MLRFWTENGPPVYVGVNSYLGIGGKKKEPSNNLDSLAAAFASTGGHING